MKNWYLLLSPNQRTWLFASVLVMIIISMAGLLVQSESKEREVPHFTVANTIAEIVPGLGVTGKALARELKLPVDVPKRKPLKALGTSDEKLQEAVHHLLSHKDATSKYFIYAALVLGALVFMVRLGRPDNTTKNQRKLWYPRLPYTAVLLLSVIVCGFLIGKSPNPMEGSVKIFKAMAGLYPSVWIKLIAMIFFIVLAVVGNKMICGWACPFGALQELIYSIPMLKKIKRKKPPFILTNFIRVAIFALVLLLLFGVVGGRKGLVIYHYINPFNLFNFDFDNVGILIAVILFLLAAFAVYRPFCQLICPFGLISWAFEKLSIHAVRIDHNSCTKCGACIKACPTQATRGKVYGNMLPSDCFSCARCLNVCPEDAITYGSTINKRLIAD